jgi:hypothetical protein
MNMTELLQLLLDIKGIASTEQVGSIDIVSLTTKIKQAIKIEEERISWTYNCKSAEPV